jgi:SmpA / OmlA family
MKNLKYWVVILLIQSCSPWPSYHPKWSPACTLYAEGFTEARFDQLRVGMSRDSVVLLLGKPLEIQETFYPERKLKDGSVSLYNYTLDWTPGLNCPYDYAWLGREVFFDDLGKVTAFCRSIHHD